MNMDKTTSGGLEEVSALCAFCVPDFARVVYLTRSFYAMVSLGALVPGYVLLIPRAHLANPWQLSADDRADYASVTARLRTVLEQAYGRRLVVYNHINAPICASIEGVPDVLCTHTHWHFLPSAGELDLSAAQARGILTGPVWQGSPAEIFDAGVDPVGEYFYLEALDGSASLYESFKPDRQFGRWLACRANGIRGEFANWERYADPFGLIDSTIAFTRTHLNAPHG